MRGARKVQPQSIGQAQGHIAGIRLNISHLPQACDENVHG